MGHIDGTRVEGDEVARIVGVTPLMGADALESTVRAAESPALLHLATHGFFLSDQPLRPQTFDLPADPHQTPSPSENPMLRSGLALAGANTWLRGQPPPPEAEDGILTAQDVCGLDLNGTEMAVLSACDTALGAVRPGEGVFGLRRAFAIAGVGTLIISLWKVSDAETCELMVLFYKNLFAGIPRILALRMAQLAVFAKHPEPYYWAAFICQGETGPLRLCRWRERLTAARPGATSDTMLGRVYALLVGIDNYPDSRSRLRGCGNDVMAMLEYLVVRVPEDQLSVRLLRDSAATRSNIISAFRDHLSSAGVEDTAFFFYAGHGSQEKAPPVFWDVEPDHLNETIVCYDSRTAGGWDLADKELALLCAEAGRAGAHVLVVLDCCHSGSGTRNLYAGATVRQLPARPVERPPDTYLTGVEQLTGANAQRTVTGRPRIGHILLAACRDEEEAKEYPMREVTRGCFSYFLLDALQTSQNPLSYRDLGQRIQALVSAAALGQTPQIEASDDAELNQAFLGGAVPGSSGFLLVRYDHRLGWMVAAGRMHGIPLPSGDEVTLLALFDGSATQLEMQRVDRAITTARVKEVQAGRSSITVANPAQLDRTRIYQALITAIPLPACAVKIDGEAEGVVLARHALMTASPQGGPSPDVREVSTSEELRLFARMGKFIITRSSDQRPLVSEIIGYTPENAKRTVSRLEHISRWNQILNLRHPTSGIRSDEVDLALLQGGAGDTALTGIDLRLRYVMVQGRWRAPSFRVRMTNHGKRDLYVALLTLSEMYEVNTALLPQGTVKLRAGETVWALDGKAIYAGIPERSLDATECRDQLKLIVSTLEFDARLFSQPALDAPQTRGSVLGIARNGTLNRLLERLQTRTISTLPPEPEIDDFFTRTVTLTTERPKGS